MDKRGGAGGADRTYKEYWFLNLTGYVLLLKLFSVIRWEGCGVLKIPIDQKFERRKDYVPQS